MTSVEEVRAELGRMVFQARHHIACGDGEQGDPISVNRLLRVAREALDVLDRHGPMDGCPDVCSGCESEIPIYPPSWPCPEVASVLRAWQP